MYIDIKNYVYESLEQDEKRCNNVGGIRAKDIVMMKRKERWSNDDLHLTSHLQKVAVNVVRYLGRYGGRRTRFTL